MASTLTPTPQKEAPPALPARRMVLGVQEPEDMDLPTDPIPLNMGPSHPAMHGTVRMVVDVEGEKITNVDIQIGYLHRCFEKESEYATYTQIFPYTDRLNYVSPMLNNVGYAMAVEKLMGIADKLPERAAYIRVIVGEVSRITDHMTCLGAGAIEIQRRDVKKKRLVSTTSYGCRPVPEPTGRISLGGITAATGSGS